MASSESGSCEKLNTQWSSDSRVIPRWWVSSLSFMFSEKTAGETFCLESSLTFRSLILDTSLSRAEPEINKSTKSQEEGRTT